MTSMCSVMIQPRKRDKLSASVSPHLFRHGPEGHQEGEEEVEYEVEQEVEEEEEDESWSGGFSWDLWCVVLVSSGSAVVIRFKERLLERYLSKGMRRT